MAKRYPVFGNTIGGLTGSLQEASLGIPYLLAGPSITLITNSNGSIEVTGSAGGGSTDSWVLRSATEAMSTATTAQNIFQSGSDTFTLESSSIYTFEFYWSVERVSGATTLLYSLFGGSATFSKINHMLFAAFGPLSPVTNTRLATPSYGYIQGTNFSEIAMTPGASSYNLYQVKQVGWFETSSSGSWIPQFRMFNATTGNILAGARLSLRKISESGTYQVGGWA